MGLSEKKEDLEMALRMLGEVKLLAEKHNWWVLGQLLELALVEIGRLGGDEPDRGPGAPIRPVVR